MLRRYSKAAGKVFRVVWKKGSKFLAYPKDNMTHAQLVDRALDYLNAFPGRYAFPTHGVKNHPEMPGISDILVCDDGAFVAAEAKVGRDQQSDDQVEFETDIRESRGRYLIFHDADELIAAFPRTGGRAWHSQPEPRKNSGSSRKAPSAGASTATGTTPAKPRASRRRSAGSQSASKSPGEPSA